MNDFYSLDNETFEEMGHTLPASIEEITLWRSVIIRAIEDALQQNMDEYHTEVS